MEGRAFAWFQWMSSNGQFTSWPVFLQALQTRFAPSHYEDPTGTLFKLTPKGTVTQYLSEFEDLANHVIGLPAPFLLSCFVSSLAPDIRREFQAHQPLTIVQAVGLACLQEKLHDPRLPPRFRPAPPSTPTPLTLPPAHIPLSPALLPSPSRPPTSLTVHRLTPEELASRHEKGLCFSCDEKFHRRHKCAPKVHLLIAEDDDPNDPSLIESGDPTSYPIDGPDPLAAHISLHSLTGLVAPETLRLIATVVGHTILVLIDDGSTHNFIQQALADQLGLPRQTTSALRVMVGNGQHLDCTSFCKAVTIDMQITSFMVDLYILPIAGANIVLGVQWFQSLGTILTYYNTLHMQFFYKGQLIELRGDYLANSG